MTRFGVKAAFRITLSYTRRGRPKKVFYEVRVLNLEAGSELSATRKAMRLLAGDDWTARPGHGLASHRQELLGIVHVENLSVCEPEEVWYELTDERPRVTVQAPAAKGSRT